MYGEEATHIRKLAQERAREAFEAEKVAKETERIMRDNLFFVNLIALTGYNMTT